MKSNKSGRRVSRVMVLLAATSIIAAACGSDDNASDATSAATQPAATTPAATTPAATTPAATEPPAPSRPAPTRRPVAPPPPTSTRTETARSCSASLPPVPPTTARTTKRSSTPPKTLSTENGFEDPIVVDNIQAADAATAMGDLAQQGVDVIIVGASEIAEPLPDLISKYPDVFWYCNCGAGFPPNPGLSQSTDDGSEISYTAGYATGSEAEGEGW